MPDDHIRYDLLAQQALRGVVRTVLADVAKKGLPGEHHFKITLNTGAPGVRMSDRLRAQYPEVMTIILQHQFWDLAVGERAFEVGLSFGGITERLAVPFDSIVAFYDPAVQFGFQFEAVDEAAAAEGGEAAKAAPADEDKSAQKPAALPPGKSAAGKKSEPAAAPGETAEPPSGGDDKPDGGGEVVRLDRFRKK
ncbi:MAG: ClpXP protease specificity-enhancing factor SspB [Xanthobacteraceae bacterium]